MPEPVYAAPRARSKIALAGDLYDILVDGAATRGASAVVHTIVGPGGGPPPHTHTREDEVFYVLSGNVEFQVGGRALTAGPGALLFAPRGVEHRFHNPGATPLELLITIQPAGLEGFFRAAGDEVPADAAPPPVTAEQRARLFRLAPEYGLLISPPG